MKLGSLLVISEDARGYDTVVEVVQRLLVRKVVGFDPKRVGFEPANDDARHILAGNKWKSTKPADRRAKLDLVRAIANAVARTDGFVFFHVDADRCWSAPGTCVNEAAFDREIRAKVRLVLEDAHHDSAEAERVVSERLFLVMPYYSIESWLLQHTTKAIELLEKHHLGQGIARVQTWATDRTALDEVDKPKTATHLTDQHNLALAGKGYPVEAVFDAERSYHRAFAPVVACESLRAVLEQAATYGSN